MSSVLNLAEPTYIGFSVETGSGYPCQAGHILSGSDLL